MKEYQRKIEINFAIKRYEDILVFNLKMFCFTSTQYQLNKKY